MCTVSLPCLDWFYWNSSPGFHFLGSEGWAQRGLCTSVLHSGGVQGSWLPMSGSVLLKKRKACLETTSSSALLAGVCLCKSGGLWRPKTSPGSWGDMKMSSGHLWARVDCVFPWDESAGLRLRADSCLLGHACTLSWVGPGNPKGPWTQSVCKR